MAVAAEARRELPPGPQGRRLRHLGKRFRDTAGLFEELQESYGDIVRYELPGRSFCVVSDADLMREVLVVKRASFAKSDIGKGVMRLPTILTGDGEEHTRRRKLMHPSFNKRQADWFGEVVVRNAATRQRLQSSGQTIDLKKEMHLLALDIACEAFFGDDTPANPGLIDAVLATQKWKVVRALLPMSKLITLLPLPANFRAHRTLAEMDAVFDKAIAAARQAGPGARYDVVSVLVHAQDEEGEERSFTDEEVREDAYVLLFAGHETCANALTWCFSRILRQPEVLQRLEAELDGVSGGAPLQAEDVARLPYTRAVFAEALRLMPPIHYVSRRAIEDCTIGGYFIPRDTVMQCAIRVLHMNRRHFPHPREFRPERWLEDRPSHPKNAYLPFGSGPRICIGRELALVQGPLVLAGVLGKWRLHLAQTSGFDEARSMALYEYGSTLLATLEERDHARQ